MDFVQINKILEESPGAKSFWFQEYETAKLKESEIRAQVYLEKCQIPIELNGKVWKIPVKQVEALVDSDNRVLEIMRDRIRKEMMFHEWKDKLEAYMEIARNLRSEVRWIEPIIKEN